MELLVLILLIVAAVCFLGAAANVAVSRVNLIAAGLFCWVLTVIVGHASSAT